MAYDSKLNIGQQVANPGNPQLGQVTVYEQKITTIPVLDSKQTTIPVLDSRQTSSQLQNTARQIDLLSMDQFGHNQSILRKDLSILEANSVNTDKEYGVMQVEDRFEFSQLSEEPIESSANEVINIHSGWVMNYPTQGVSHIGDRYGEANDQYLANYGSGAVGAFAIPFVEVHQIGSIKELSNIQLIHLNGGTTKSYIIDNDGTNKEILEHGGVETLDTITNRRGALKINPAICSRPEGIGYQCVAIGFTIKNNSNDIIKFKLNTFDPYGESETTIVPDASGRIEVGYNGNTGRMEGFRLKFHIVGEDVGGIEIWYDFDCSWSATLMRNCVLKAKTVEYNIVSGIINSGIMYPLTGYKFPLLDIYMDVKSNDGSTDSCNLLLTNIPSGSKMYDIYTGEFNDSESGYKVRDLSYVNHFIGQFIKGTSDEVNPAKATYKKYLLKSISATASEDSSVSTNTYSYLCLPSSVKEYAYFNTRKESDRFYSRSLITGYNKLIDVSDMLSIGLIKRSNNTYQIGIKYNNTYFTARGDDSLSPSYLELTDINIISNGSDYVSFIAKIHDNVLYYCFHSFAEYDGGKLIREYEQQYDFYFVDMKNKSMTDIDIDHVPGILNVDIAIHSVDENLYKKRTNYVTVGIHDTTSLIMSFNNSMLKESITEINHLGVYVIKNLCIPFMIGLNRNIGQIKSDQKTVISGVVEGQQSLNLITLPTASKDTYLWNSLPLKMEDEYPEIYNEAEIGDNRFLLGKTSFVNVNGSIYEAGSLSLCPNTGKVYVTETNAKMYVCYPYLLLAKSNLTNVYQFTELGMQLTMTVEDEIICNPVISSVGVVMCGRTGIWTLTKEGVVKIWGSTKTILQASLKTDLDNSCIAIIDDDSFDVQVLAGSQLPGVLDEDVIATDYIDDTMEYPVCCGISIFTAVTINQSGFVSSQKINTNLNTVDFIDIGAESELLILDLVGSGSLNTLVKGTATETSFTIQSNQLIEMYQETVYTTLNKIRLFAKGNGTITVTVNDTVVGTVTVYGARFEEYSLTLNNEMNMLDYKITCTAGVKLMQRVVGIITTKEEFYG